MKRLLKRLSLQWRITLLTILLLATACVTMKNAFCAPLVMPTWIPSAIM